MTAVATTPSPPGPKPVFLHSGFRTSSTWLWSKLRAAPTTVAYYEVFHDVMAEMDVNTARNVTFDGWRSRHPPSAPYFLEFLPLLEDGRVGVPDYMSAMALERFLPEDGVKGHLSAQEIAYLDRLVSHARRQDKTAVLSDVRTLGRITAVRNSLPCLNVLIIRNIFHQWASCTRQSLEGNTYFFNYIALMIDMCARDPTISSLSGLFTPRQPTSHSESYFIAFIIFHLYLYAQGFDACDLIIDVSNLATDRDARCDVEGFLGQAIGHPVDLSDIRVGFEVSVVDVKYKGRFVDIIEQCSKVIIDACGPRLAKRTAFVQRIKDDLLIEWDRNEFYAGALRSIYVESQTQSVRALEADRIDGAALRSDLEHRLEAAHLVAAQLVQQRDHALEEAARLQQSLDAMSAQLAEAVALQTRLAGEAETIRSVEMGLAQSVEAVTASRDELAARLAVLTAHLAELEASRDLLTAERDALAARLAEATRPMPVSTYLASRLSRRRRNGS